MTIINCEECSQPISDAAYFCPHCGRPGKAAKSIPVAVGDIDMHFGTMVGILVKLAFAIIPAAIIVAFLGAIIWAALSSLR